MNNLFFKPFILSSLLAILMAAPTYSKTLYIQDKIYVPVRKGQGNQFSILHRGLPTGTKVTYIEGNDEWTKVLTQGGIEGWIRNQFLSETPPASIQLDVANQKIQSITNELQKLKNENTTLKSSYSDSQEALKSSQQEIKNTQQELQSIRTISASAVESHQRLQELAEKMQKLTTENDVLKSENESLRNSERTKFFLYGALTLLLGVFVAVVVPKLRGQKRNNGWIN